MDLVLKIAVLIINLFIVVMQICAIIFRSITPRNLSDTCKIQPSEVISNIAQISASALMISAASLAIHSPDVSFKTLAALDMPAYWLGLITISCNTSIILGLLSDSKVNKLHITTIQVYMQTVVITCFLIVQILVPYIMKYASDRQVFMIVLFVATVMVMMTNTIAMHDLKLYFSTEGNSKVPRYKRKIMCMRATAVVVILYLLGVLGMVMIPIWTKTTTTSIVVIMYRMLMWSSFNSIIGIITLDPIVRNTLSEKEKIKTRRSRENTRNSNTNARKSKVSRHPIAMTQAGSKSATKYESVRRFPPEQQPR